MRRIKKTYLQLADSFGDKRIEMLISVESRAQKTIETFCVLSQNRKIFDVRFVAQLNEF